MNAMFIPSTGNKLQKREDFGNNQVLSGSSKIDDATLTAVMNRLAELEKVKKSFKIAKRKLFTLYYMAYEKNFSRCHRKGK